VRKSRNGAEQEDQDIDLHGQASLLTEQTKLFVGAQFLHADDAIPRTHQHIIFVNVR
jgi:hypothetical protein